MWRVGVCGVHVHEVGCLLLPSLSSFRGRVSSLNPKLSVSASILDHQAPRITYLCPQHQVCRCVQPYLAVYLCAGGSNAGPHAFWASLLTHWAISLIIDFCFLIKHIMSPFRKMTYDYTLHYCVHKSLLSSPSTLLFLKHLCRFKCDHFHVCLNWS